MSAVRGDLGDEPEDTRRALVAMQRHFADSLQEAAREAMRQQARQKERFIMDRVGIEFRQTVRVIIRRPRWMPDSIYRRLMRTIVIEERPTTYSSAEDI